MRVLIIAEAGVNHNGRLDWALELIEAAAQAGADAVKFQAFKARRLAAAHAPKADYQKRTTGEDQSQREMLEALELGPNDFKALMDHCRRLGVEFLASAFDPESLDSLLELGMERIKIPSGEITNLPLLRKAGASRRPILLSTGMADLGDIEDALDALYLAGTRPEGVTLLHCTTEYPAAPRDANLRVLETLRRAFGVQVGYSDHSQGIEISVAAAALGARVIEKHFTLDRTLPGPDHEASLEPADLAALVQAIRNVEEALGNGLKKPSPVEMANRRIVRQSIVAAVAIPKGIFLEDRHLATRRPADGLSPMLWDQVVGRRADRDYAPGDPLFPDAVWEKA